MVATIHLIRHGQAAFGAADYDELSALGHEQASLLGAALAPLAGEGDVAICGGMRRHRQTAQACLRAMAGANARDQSEVASSPACASGTEVGPSAAGERVPGPTPADERALSPSSASGIGVGVRAAPLIEDPHWNEFDHAQIIARYRPEYADHARLVAALRAQPDPRRGFQSLFAAAMARWCGGEFDHEYGETWTAFQARCRAAAQAAADRADGAGNVWVFTSGGPIAAVVQGLLELSDAQAMRLSWTLVNAGVTQLHLARGGLRLSTFNGHAHLYSREGLISHR